MQDAYPGCIEIGPRVSARDVPIIWKEPQMPSIVLRSRTVFAILLVGLMLLNAPLSLAQTGEATNEGLLVYHQITKVEHQTRAIGFPVISADGTRAVFVDAPGTGDEAIPNRIFVIGTDGAGLTEVDAYKTGCYCGSEVDISADGGTIVSTESVQLRIVRGTGAAQTLVALTSNNMSSIRLTADGDRVFFIIGNDSQLAESDQVLERGIYSVEADGSDLRQIIGPSDIADLLGVGAETIGMGRLYTQALDISADGSQVIFAAYTAAGMAVLTAQGDGGGLSQIGDSVSYAQRVAISGDGSMVAYDVVPLNTSINEVWVSSFAGGQPLMVAPNTNSGWYDPLQLSEDGSQLLISPNALLIDSDTGETRQLAVPSGGIGGNHDSVLTDGLPRATMNADATRFVYAMRTARCADCVNLHEQLALLEIGPADLGDAPEITDTEVNPASIPLNYVSAATVQAQVSESGKLLGVGLVALLDGVFDVNVGRGLMLFDDGTNGDQTAGDGIFTNSGVVHGPVVVREDDTGPRMLRVEAEIETADGFRHATAVEFGPLTVVAD